MKRKLHYVFTLAVLLVGFSVFGQENLWQNLSKNEVVSKKQLYTQIEPINVNYYALNLEQLRNSLENSPQRGTSSLSDGLIIQFPNFAGKMESYRIQEASTMTPELQAQFPQIRSYSGFNVDNPAAIIRFSVSPEKGLSAMVLSDKKTIFIEPYSDDLLVYRVFIRTEEDRISSQFVCETEQIDQNKVMDNAKETASRNANDGTLRTFRLALACTAEYSNFHGGTLNSVMAAMNATMTRVNGIYERDVALTMVMVPNNSIIYFNATTDPYSNNNGSAMLNQNQTTCNTNIGSANYDIGHVFSTGGGGIAQLNAPCGSGKARGVTGLQAPVNDAFDIDYVAHEMGHQYGANHTQNNNCQRSSKSYEPGSASTIMGYAGICAPNIQNNSDDYFHGESIREMWANISAGASQCATQSNTGNSAPVAIAGSNYTIPKSTPFILRGAATDANAGNSLTYCWEQLDATPAQMPPVSTSTVGPAFRSLRPKQSPNRYMPDFSTVLSGSTATTWEVVPSVGRVMNFNLTVRDNASGGGNSDSDTMSVTTASNAGPFIVTSQNTNETWDIGSSRSVTWDVANTNLSPVNTANVNILMSINGGITFPYTLASNVPNDGAHDVIVPAGTETTQARIIVEAAGNIFYDVNASNFTIVQTEFVLNFASTDETVCQPNNAVYNFIYKTFMGFTGTTTFSASNVPTGATVSFSPTTATADGTNVVMTVSNTSAIAIGSYSIQVTGTSGAISNSTNVILNVYSSSINATTLVSPTNGATEVSTDVNLVWNTDVNADNYFVELATDMNFTNTVSSANVSGSMYAITLNDNTLYYWRVTASNQCATAAASVVYSFTTANITCNTFSATDLPLAISESGANTVNSVLTVAPNLPIDDVNVTINIDHTYDADLTISLTSPAGTTVILSNGNGDSGNNYTNTVFDQQASNPITTGSPPFTGTYIPEGDLSSFNGEMSGGDWTLTVLDGFNEDGGTFLNFDLNLCVQGVLSVSDNEFAEFVIFPNPNTGEFTVKLNSNSSEKIQITVYDVRGRKVFENRYTNSSRFAQDIDLQNVQSGLYMVKVSDGLRTQTEKVIVK